MSNFEKKILDQKGKNPMLVFIVGNSRSGTTIMARLIGRSESVHALNELHFFEEQWSPHEISSSLTKETQLEMLSKLLNKERDDYIGKKRSKEFLQEANNILNTFKRYYVDAQTLFQKFLLYEAALNNKHIACEQTPRNIFYAKEILTYYPDAKIINMVRDPRAILLSQKNRWRIRSLGAKNFPFREVIRSWANYHPITTSLLWNSAINVGNEMHKNRNFKTVKYEDFTSKPKLIIREICEFLNVPYNDEILMIQQSEGGVSSFQRRDKPQGVGINSEAASRWMKGGLNRSEILICQQLTKKNMESNSYEPLHFSMFANFPILLFYTFTFPLKLLVALIFNVSQHKNLIATVRRRMSY